jgi:S1-C subfamily serine protease
VVITIDGAPVDSVDVFSNAVQLRSPEQRISLAVAHLDGSITTATTNVVQDASFDPPRSVIGVALANRPAGALVRDVPVGQPAANAGVVAGDVVTAIDGQLIQDGQSLVDAVGARQPGQVIRISLMHVNGDSGETSLALAG